jgi:2-methylcitrate dehydratase PrpD
MFVAAESVADWATGLTLDDVPQDVVEAAKLHLLDTLGCGLAAHALGVADEGRAMITEMRGTPHATVIGSTSRFPAANAALANAMLCHGLDFDDTHSESVAHVSSVIVPAALAAAEQHGVAGRELLAAIVAGNEVVCRIGMAAPGEFHRRGFHSTSVCGIFGAAASVSALTGLNQRAATHALGIAGSFASGLLAFLGDGVSTKPMHPAWAAHGAHAAVRLAFHGAHGPRSVLDGRFGLFNAFLGSDAGAVDIRSELSDLGSRWETLRIAFKPYPVCHFMHGSLGAAAKATAGRTFASEEIDYVLVRIPAAGVALVLEPAEVKQAPRSDYEGKFSLQYSIASQLVRGHVSVGDFSDLAIADPEVLAVAAKVRYETEDYATYPRAFPGAATICLVDGTRFDEHFPFQKGGPENPMAINEVLEKFRQNASMGLSDDSLMALEEAVLSLEDQPDVASLLAPLALVEIAAA